MTALLEEIKNHLKKNGKEKITPEIKPLVDLITNSKRKGLSISDLLFERLFDSKKPYWDSNSTGTHNPIYNLLLLLMWMKIHGPFHKIGYNTWVVNETLRIELPNEVGSCYVAIITNGEEEWSQQWSQQFNPSAMVSAINQHMMEPYEIEQQKQSKEMPLKNTLCCKVPLKCGDDCHFCRSERIHHDTYFGGSYGT